MPLLGQLSSWLPASTQPPQLTLLTGGLQLSVKRLLGKAGAVSTSLFICGEEGSGGQPRFGVVPSLTRKTLGRAAGWPCGGGAAGAGAEQAGEARAFPSGGQGERGVFASGASL